MRAAAAVAMSLSVVVLSALPIAGLSQAADFKGKTVTVSIGFGAGGGYDIYGRLLARHLGAHLPGEPTVVPRNMPGAGGLTLANHLFNAAPKDGTALGLLASSSVIEPLLGNDQAKFDLGRFIWIGNMAPTITACGVWQSSGITGWDDFARRPLRMGGTGPGGITAQHTLVIKNLMGLDLKLIQGYTGITDVVLAMQRGEVDGACGLFASADGPYVADIKSGSLKIIVQFGRRNAPLFGDAPNFYQLVKSDDDRRVAEFVFRQTELARPIAAPPGVADDIVAALRTGFDSALRSPALLVDAQKTGVEIDTMTGAELAKAFATFVDTPQRLIERAKEATTKQ